MVSRANVRVRSCCKAALEQGTLHPARPLQLPSGKMSQRRCHASSTPWEFSVLCRSYLHLDTAEATKAPVVLAISPSSTCLLLAASLGLCRRSVFRPPTPEPEPEEEEGDEQSPSAQGRSAEGGSGKLLSVPELVDIKVSVACDKRCFCALCRAYGHFTRAGLAVQPCDSRSAGQRSLPAGLVCSPYLGS